MLIKNHDLYIALEAARAGARVIQENFGKTNDSKVKGNSKGLVTQTDLESEAAILNVLRSNTDYRILSEEEGWLGEKEGPVWVVDPLDGTNNFAHSLPFFAVSVALMDKDEALIGVIIDPVHNKEYYAVSGNGSFCNGKQLKRSKYNSGYIPTLILNHGYHETDKNKFKELSNLLASNYNILKLGTTALELCYIANGSADGFICSGDELWDFAAGIVITKEAGCIFTDWKGNLWNRNESHILFASPEIHLKLVKQISPLQESA